MSGKHKPTSLSFTLSCVDEPSWELVGWRSGSSAPRNQVLSPWQPESLSSSIGSKGGQGQGASPWNISKAVNSHYPATSNFSGEPSTIYPSTVHPLSLPRVLSQIPLPSGASGLLGVAASFCVSSMNSIVDITLLLPRSSKVWSQLLLCSSWPPCPFSYSAALTAGPHWWLLIDAYNSRSANSVVLDPFLSTRPDLYDKQDTTDVVVVVVVTSEVRFRDSFFFFTCSPWTA